MSNPTETETTPTTTETPAEPATAPAAVEVAATPTDDKRFSQEELDSILEKRLAKERRATEKRVREELVASQTKPHTEQTPKATAAPQSNDDIAALRAEIAKERNDRKFAEAVSGLGVKLNATQRKLLRSQFDPEDPDGLEDIAKDAGFVRPQAPAQTQTAATQATAPTNGGPAHVQKQATYQDPGAPNGDPDTARGSDLMSWSKDDVQRARENGTFLDEVRKFRNSLPGGNPGGLFVKRNRALGK